MTYANGLSTLPAAPLSTVLSGLEKTEPCYRVSFSLVRALLEVVQLRGVSPQSLLGHHVELNKAERTDAYVPRSEFSALLARAISLTGDPALGLHCGLFASEASFGLMAPLVAHAASLRRGIELVIQFHALLVDGIELTLLENAGVAQLRCEIAMAFAEDRSFIELQVAGLVRAIQALGCPRSEIRAVRFEHSRPAYHHVYTRAFGGAERFAQPYCAIEFSASTLDAPHLHHDGELHALMLSQAERSLQRTLRPMSWAERVRSLIYSRPIAALPDMEQAARKLGLSVRSLRRYLEASSSAVSEPSSSENIVSTMMSRVRRIIRSDVFSAWPSWKRVT
jgi:hypothetical protein